MKRRTFLSRSLSVAAAFATPHALQAAASEPPLVRTGSGPVRGKTQDGIAHFLGIPYGADTRTRRFQPAVPPTPWTEVRDCTRFAAGNPNCSAIPHWPQYDLRERDTMLWQMPTRVAHDPRGNERRLAAGAHYRQPGT